MAALSALEQNIHFSISLIFITFLFPFIIMIFICFTSYAIAKNGKWFRRNLLLLALHLCKSLDWVDALYYIVY